MEYNGKCQCERVTYTIPNKPKEIANCHCTICQKLHKTPFVSFAKYDINDIKFTDKKNLTVIKSSEHATRN